MVTQSYATISVWTINANKTNGCACMQRVKRQRY